MKMTLTALKDIERHLSEHLPDWAIELMPDDPSDYHLAHPNGAILLSYAGSKFDKPRPTHAITQSRHIHIVCTVICRHLHHDEGAIDVLDELRLLLVGFRPSNCNPIYLLDEQFDGVANTIWQYQLALCCETVQVEQVNCTQSGLPTLTEVIPRYRQDTLDTRLKPKQSNGEEL